MKKILSISVLTLIYPLAFGFSIAEAHQHGDFMIGGKKYQIVVGSLGEPVVVDSQTGVDLRVSAVGGSMMPGMNMANDGDGDHEEAGMPVTGLDKTLKVEISAGSKKKTFDLTAVYGTPGSYKAVFMPTIQTSYTYRFFGTINNTPVDISFSCLPEGSTAVDDTKATNLSDKVQRLNLQGGFGCPVSKANIGFPETVSTLADLSAANSKLETSAGMADTKSNIAIGLSGVAIIGAIALALRKKNVA